MAISTLDDLFLHTLKDIYYAEKQIKKSLPKMMRKASSPKLARALEAHLEETNEQIEMLQGVFEMLGKPARGVKCEAIEGILEEADEILSEISDEFVRDAAIIAASQAVEHYEICRYNSLIAWATPLGHSQMIKPLQAILAQETATEAKLATMAKAEVNPKAQSMADDKTSKAAPSTATKKPAMKKAV